MGATASKDKRRKQHPQHHQQQQQERKPKPEAEAKNNKVIKLGNDSSKPNSDNESHKQHPSNHSSPGNSAGIPIRGMKGSPKNASGLHQNGGSRGSSLITDDEVKVNLAMADLMAFLLVVANNSNNLPLTRRDDPEAAKTVSTLTSDEYARKSAAFVPADVRVIGGSFLKYGRVWDLPTSREYSANDGVQEPGLSYGGACCNAMLKVLYDAENESADANNVGAGRADPNSLFDDDDDQTIGTAISLSRTCESLLLGDIVTPLSISWADLLRKMKAEMQDLDYAQAPIISSTRKFDLNKPFSLIPEGFDRKTNQKRSLLIGCNYNDDVGATLKASHDDVRSMKDYIVNVHGFPETKGLMTVLMDDSEHKSPTHSNITDAFKALSEQSRPGDTVFVLFSGHGGRILDSSNDDEAETYDEVIAPSDYKVSGLIRDTLIFKTLLAPMRYGVTVTILIDTCDTGMMLDLPYAWTTKTDRIETHAKMSVNDNFSFVRFLKVVKTLYESSTFTQLGRTVGSALKNNRDEVKQDDDDDTLENRTRSSIDDEDDSRKPSTARTSFLDAITGCTSEQYGRRKESPIQKKENSDGDMDTREKQPYDRAMSKKPNFLEQVMTCTLGTDPGAESDEDTYNVRDGDHSFGAETTTTFETYDDGYDSAPRAYEKGRQH